MIIEKDSNAEVNRIKQLIVKAGDEGSEYFKRDLIKLTDELTEYYLLNRIDLRDTIVKVLQEAISLFPLKSGIYATLVALLSIKPQTGALAELIIQTILDQLATLWQEPSPIIGRNVMGFLGELMNVGLLNSVNFVECLYDLENGAESEKYPYYLSILLSTIPRIMVRATEKNQIEFKNIIQNVEGLMTKRTKFYETDELDLLWLATRQFLSAGLSSSEQNAFLQKSYPRPYFIFSDEIAQVKQIRKNFKIVVHKREAGWCPQPILLFVKDYIQTDPKVFMQQEIVRQWIQDTLILFKTNKLILVLQFEHYSKFNGLSPIQETTLKRLTTQTLINQLIDVKPSKGEMSTVFYSSLLISLAQRENKNEFIEYVEQCVDEVLTKHGEDQVVLEVLAQFLSHFLSNITLKWNWDKVISQINGENGEVTFHKHFYAAVFLERLFAMIQVGKVTDLVPKELLQWYDSQLDPRKPNPEILNIDNNVETINSLLSAKTPSAELKKNLATLSSNSDVQYQQNLSIFTEQLLLRMSASITHLSILSRRYKEVFSQPEFVSQQQSTEILLNTLYHVWGHSMFHMETYIQEFYVLGLFKLEQLVRWAVSYKREFNSLKEAQKFANLEFSLLHLARTLFSNTRAGSLDESQASDLNLSEAQLIFALLDQLSLPVALRIQLYLLAALSSKNIETGSITKTIKGSGKYQKEYVAAVISSL